MCIYEKDRYVLGMYFDKIRSKKRLGTLEFLSTPHNRVVGALGRVEAKQALPDRFSSASSASDLVSATSVSL